MFTRLMLLIYSEVRQESGVTSQGLICFFIRLPYRFCLLYMPMRWLVC